MASESGPEQGVGQRLRRFARRLPPRISQQLDEHLESALTHFDRLNRSLAARAIPRERRERVNQRSEKDGPSRSGRLRVVSEDTE